MDKRTKEYKELAEITDLVIEKIDGEIFQYRRGAKCRVCNADPAIVQMVDALMVRAYTYQKVLDLVGNIEDKLQVPEKDRISYTSLVRHTKNHLPYERIAARLLLERKAGERSKAILKGVDNLLTAEAYFETIAAQSYADVVSGKITPDLNQGMKAMEIVDAMEKEATSDQQVRAVMAEFQFFLESVKRHVSPEVMAGIVQELEQRKRGEVDKQPEADYTVEAEEDEISPRIFDEELTTED